IRHQNRDSSLVFARRCLAQENKSCKDRRPYKQAILSFDDMRHEIGSSPAKTTCHREIVESLMAERKGALVLQQHSGSQKTVQRVGQIVSDRQWNTQVLLFAHSMSNAL